MLTKMVSMNLFTNILLYMLFCVICETYSLYHRRISYKDSIVEQTKNFSDVLYRDLENSITIAEDQVRKLATLEWNIQTSGLKTEKISPSYGQMVDFLPSDEAVNNTKSAFIAIKAAQHLASKYCYRLYSKSKECTKQLSSIKLYETKLGKVCIDIYENIKCNHEEEYRTTEGYCNNLKNPAWGRSSTPYRRLLPADYDDDLYTLRGSSNEGRELPSARLISVNIAEPMHIPDLSRTQAMAIWGLFIGHDMAYTPASNMVNIKTPITCCTSEGRPLSPRYNHISCAPITIPVTDLFYKNFFQTCMNYVRSLPAMRSDCTLGPTEQMNQASHFLDGSVIYGSTEKKAKSLRAMWGGRLITSMQKGGSEYPPLTDRNKIACHLRNISECYNAGDMRINSQPQLGALHTLFIREHNRIADGLATLNDRWDDERLYQESKRIVIAEIQHITYTQWLPRILGRKYMMNHGLDVSQNAFNDAYDDRIEPTVSNSFATAGLPFINSMLDGNIGLYLEDRKVVNVTELKNHFVTQSLLNDNQYLDNVIRGLATQNSQKIDATFSDALTHYWYSSTGDFGMDLFSLDIQRGRDHGIPSYVHFRKVCNLSEIVSFKDLRGIISQGIISRLEKIYNKVGDIDLIVGAIAEYPLKDAMVGPTLQCIIGEQFVRSKIGDKYFYDNRQQPKPFSKAQLEQVRRSNLARIFCDNSHNITTMQRDVFQIPDDQKNILLNCRETAIPFINLSYWNDEENLQEESQM